MHIMVSNLLKLYPYRLWSLPQRISRQIASSIICSEEISSVEDEVIDVSCGDITTSFVARFGAKSLCKDGVARLDDEDDDLACAVLQKSGLQLL